MMNKLLSLSVLFLLFFLIASVYSAKAGVAPSNPGECVRSCNMECSDDVAEFLEIEFGLICSELTGEDRKECNTFFNILVRCCVTECMEENPGCLNTNEAPEESVICEVLDEICNDD